MQLYSKVTHCGRRANLHSSMSGTRNANRRKCTYRFGMLSRLQLVSTTDVDLSYGLRSNCSPCLWCWANFLSLWQPLLYRNSCLIKVRGSTLVLNCTMRFQSLGTNLNEDFTILIIFSAFALSSLQTDMLCVGSVKQDDPLSESTLCPTWRNGKAEVLRPSNHYQRDLAFFSV